MNRRDFFGSSTKALAVIGGVAAATSLSTAKAGNSIVPLDVCFFEEIKQGDKFFVWSFGQLIQLSKDRQFGFAESDPLNRTPIANKEAVFVHTNSRDPKIFCQNGLLVLKNKKDDPIENYVVRAGCEEGRISINCCVVPPADRERVNR
jgi:hypothetical protein